MPPATLFQVPEGGNMEADDDSLAEITASIIYLSCLWCGHLGLSEKTPACRQEIILRAARVAAPSTRPLSSLARGVAGSQWVSSRYHAPRKLAMVTTTPGLGET